MRPSERLLRAAAAALLLFMIAACSAESANDDNDDRAGAGSKSSAAPVKWSGTKVDVAMITDSRGERYDPTEVTVERGDSLRFPLKSGVHNVHFLAAKNPLGVKLPAMGEYLQLPGQITGYLIDFPIGRYYFQCDIHVALGMIGQVTVKESDQ